MSRPQGAASDIGAFELAPKLTLTRDIAGTTRLEYIFLPGQTNSISASTNLVIWLPLGTSVSDSTGYFRFQDPDLEPFAHRFYRVQPSP